MPLGRLYVVSGPSGAGKSTVCKIVREKLGINLSISATSRTPRVGEKDGVDYYFLTVEEFKKNIEENQFVEYAKVHGNYYGTLKSEVENRISRGEKVILEIDVQGGIQVKRMYPDAKLIFFKAPNVEILEYRLRNRNTDKEETIALRLKNSIEELSYEKYYDVTVVNNTIEQACNDLMDIIASKGE